MLDLFNTTYRRKYIKSYCLHGSVLTGKALKAIASLVIMVMTSSRIIWFFKRYLLVHCNSCNVVYLVECSNCKQQYIGSALNFKQWFRIYKSDIKTNKESCRTARHFNNVCCHPSNPHFYLKVYVIEQVFYNDVDKDIEAFLWECEKYWQSQVFTKVYHMNSVSDLCSRKRKGCRRK